MSKTRWLVLRAVLAIVLMVGFDVLAIAVIAGLLWVPYVEWTYLHRIDLRVLLFCAASAFALLAGLVPRGDRFNPPGPEIQESSEPHLFALVKEVAEATRQPMPREIYLLNEVNAWVANRGGTMGFGGRRVMGIGVPLLQSLPAAEVKAVLAHEFGHYAAGDVKLGPWIYATRAAIARTMASFADSFLRAPFVFYGRMFMRLTMAVSRQQEYLADQESARVTGADVAARALRHIHALGPAYVAYANANVLPVLRAGFIPPIGEGFRRFVRSDSFTAVWAGVRGSTAGRTDNMFDTHPTLEERLAALGDTDAIDVVPPLGSASVFLRDPDACAVELITGVLGDENAARLKRISWERVGGDVFAAQWRGFVAAHARCLAPLMVEELPNGPESFLKFAAPITIRGVVENAQRVEFAAVLLAAAVATLLIDNGWTVEMMPGERATLKSGDVSFDPFSAVERLASGTTTESEWVDQCHRLGLSGPLSPSSMAAMGAAVPATPAPAKAPGAASIRRRRSW